MGHRLWDDKLHHQQQPLHLQLQPQQLQPSRIESPDDRSQGVNGLALESQDADDLHLPSTEVEGFHSKNFHTLATQKFRHLSPKKSFEIEFETQKYSETDKCCRRFKKLENDICGRPFERTFKKKFSLSAVKQQENLFFWKSRVVPHYSGGKLKLQKQAVHRRTLFFTGKLSRATSKRARNFPLRELAPLVECTDACSYAFPDDKFSASCSRSPYLSRAAAVHGSFVGRDWSAADRPCEARQTSSTPLCSLQKVVYAADCVSVCRGSGMASRSLQSLPSTTAISTTTATTTTTTTTTTSRGSVCVASNSSQNRHQQQLLQQQQLQRTTTACHQYHQPGRPQDYHYPRNHHQIHQPHHINPSDRHFYSPQQVRHLQELQSKHFEQEEQQCTAPSSFAELNHQYPTRIALPDGEERQFIPSVSRRSKDKVSELRRECIKPPANKTWFDLQCCASHQQISSNSSPLTGVSPPDQGNLTPASSIQMLNAAQHNILHHHPSVTSGGPPMPSTSPPSATSVRHRPRKHKDPRSGETRSGGDTRNLNASPQLTRKSKHTIVALVTNLATPKNRKESNPRKSSPQNSVTSSFCSSSSSSSSSSYSTGSSNSLINNLCGSSRFKPFASKIEGREKGSLLVPSVPENSDCYSASSPILPSVVDNKDESFLINTSVPSNSNKDLTPTLPCPSGPSSVADVTLLPCYPSSSGQTQEGTVPASISHREEPIQHQLQHYDLPQYVEVEFQQDSTASAMLSSQHYDQQFNDRLHDPLASSYSSSPPQSPSYPTESSLKFQSYTEMSSPLDVSSREANHAEFPTRISTPVELRERLHSPDLDGRIHSPDEKGRINSPDYMSERICSPVCFEDESENASAVLGGISTPTLYGSISLSDNLPENTMPCVTLHCDRLRTEISEMQTATIKRRTPPRNSRSNRPISLAADQPIGVASQPLSPCREVLHPDHCRIPKSDSKSNSSTTSLSSLDREPLLPVSSRTPISSRVSGSTSPVNSREHELADENDEASSESVDLHNESNFSVPEPDCVQQASSNSSVTALCEACYEKEVI